MKNEEGKKMIDIKKVKSEFEKYVEKYDINQGRVRLKKEHIERVAKLSKKIATKLNLTEEQIALAETIGYFHDIGRFEQIRKYDTFSDKDSENHAVLSCKVLFEEGLIHKFEIEEKYYKTIKLAVLNHNKDKIQEGLTEEENLFAKIIRDADKLDIYYTICNYDFESIFWYKNFDQEEISKLMIKEFTEDKHINYGDIKNNADQIVIFYAYIYDFNFKFSLEYLKNRKYLQEFTKAVIQNFKAPKIEEQVKEILKISEKYINQKTME